MKYFYLEYNQFEWHIFIDLSIKSLKVILLQIEIY